VLRGVGYAVTEVTPMSVYARDRDGTTLDYTIFQKWMTAGQKIAKVILGNMRISTH